MGFNSGFKGLKMTLRKELGRVGIGFIWLRTGPKGWLCEHGGEPSCSTQKARFQNK